MNLAQATLPDDAATLPDDAATLPDDAATLPDDAAALRAFAPSLQAELYAKSLHVEKLKAELAVLRRARFGRSSEAPDRDMELLIGEREESDSEVPSSPVNPEAPASPPERRKPGRKPLPEHLPREEIVHEAVCICPGCGSTRFSRIGQDEREIRGQPPEHRFSVRTGRSVPLMGALRRTLGTTLALISRKSSLAGAIRYALIRWEALCRYTTDGRLEMTNNVAERAIRPLALGRRNYLFGGGGERAAAIYTLIETARMNGINSGACLTDVISRVASHPIKRISELLPSKWQGFQPEPVVSCIAQLLDREVANEPE